MSRADAFGYHGRRNYKLSSADNLDLSQVPCVKLGVSQRMALHVSRPTAGKSPISGPRLSVSFNFIFSQSP